MAVPSDTAGAASTTDHDDVTGDASAAAPRLLALAYGGGQLAAALYQPDTMTAALLQDTPDPAPVFAQLSALLAQVQPDQVVTSGRQDERFLARLRELLAAEVADEDASRLQLQPPGDFRADNCRHRVMAIQLPAEPPGDEQTHYNFITSRIDFTQTTAIRALGGLLRYLDRRPLETLTRQPIMRLEALVLDDIMRVTGGTFQTLQVFSSDHHPSSYKAETTREGLSVFAILNKCCCPLGVAALRRMLLQPLTNRTLIEQRLDAVEFFTRADSDDVLQSLHTCLRKVKNLTPMTNRLRNSRPLPGDWRTLYDTLCGCVVIGEICRDLPATVSLFRRIAAEKSNEAQELLHALHATVNFEETRELRRFSVNLGLDETLDRYKVLYAELRDLLSSEMAAEQENLPEVIQLCSMVFLPQIGFLIMVEEWTEEVPPERWRTLPGLRFQFEDRGKVLFKSERCDVLDAQVGDVATAIRDRETQVMVRLSARVLEAVEEVHQLTSLCGELDAVIALARAAAEFNYTRPQFVEQSVIELRQSRHPLLELCVDTVVPNNFSSCGDGHRDRVKLVTGANGAGKSVYLRQVGLAVLMAHCGSFVPAAASRLGVLHQLAAVFPPAASGCGSGSAFLSELRQLCAALTAAGPRALLLVDEFGGGTLAEDGAALLAASIAELVSRRDCCPHALVSTHVHRLSSLLPSSQLLTPVYPELVVESGAQQVTFLYQMTTGCANNSYALAAARLACLPDSLVRRADQVTKALVSGAEIPSEQDLEEQQEAAVLRAQKAVQTFLEADLETEEPSVVLQRVYEEFRAGTDDPEESAVDVTRSATAETPMSALWAEQTPAREPAGEAPAQEAAAQGEGDEPAARSGDGMPAGGAADATPEVGPPADTPAGAPGADVTPVGAPVEDATPVCGTGADESAYGTATTEENRRSVYGPGAFRRSSDTPRSWLNSGEQIYSARGGVLQSDGTSAEGRFLHQRTLAGPGSHTTYTSTSNGSSLGPGPRDHIGRREHDAGRCSSSWFVRRTGPSGEGPSWADTGLCTNSGFGPEQSPCSADLGDISEITPVFGARCSTQQPFQMPSTWADGGTQRFGRGETFTTASAQESSGLFRGASESGKHINSEIPGDRPLPTNTAGGMPRSHYYNGQLILDHSQERQEQRRQPFPRQRTSDWTSSHEWSSSHHGATGRPASSSGQTGQQANWSATSERPIGGAGHHPLCTTSSSEGTERPLGDITLTPGSRKLLGGSWLSQPSAAALSCSAGRGEYSGLRPDSAEAGGPREGVPSVLEPRYYTGRCSRWSEERPGGQEDSERLRPVANPPGEEAWMEGSQFKRARTEARAWAEGV